MSNPELMKIEITQLNYELCVLRQHFTTFKKEFGNVVDKWLVTSLNDTLSAMNNMLTNCNVLNVGDTSPQIDFTHFITRNIYFCDVCKRDISNRITSLHSHVTTKEHTRNLKPYNRKRKIQPNTGKENINMQLSNLRISDGSVKPLNNRKRKIQPNTGKENINMQLSNLRISDGSVKPLNNSSNPVATKLLNPNNSAPQPSSSKQLSSIELLSGQPLFKLHCTPFEIPGLKEKMQSSKVKNTTKAPKPDNKKTEIDELNRTTKNLLQSDLEKTINELLAEVFNVNFIDSVAIKTSLKNAISPHFKYVDVHPFGSRENGTGTSSTDLDVYVDIDRSYHGVGIENKHIVMERLEKVTEILQAKPDEWINIRKVNARIPIIKIFNQMEGIDCDISFSSGLGCCNTELIKYLTNLQPIFRKMIIYLKRWLKSTALNVYINNYTLILLIMFYLQRKYLLPPIEKLQNNIEPIQIGPWNGGFQQKTTSELKLNRTEKTVKQIIGFFDYYGSDDIFYNNTLCLYLGQLVPNTDIKQLSNISLKRYNDFAKQYEDQPDLLFKFEFMNVQDPFDLANNTAKMVPLNICRKFVNLAKASFKILNK